MSCCCSSDTKTRPGQGAKQKPTRTFAFAGPAVRGDAYSLFDSGKCFRVDAGRKWYIYNDTTDSEMHVLFSFAPSNGAKKPKNSKTVVKPMPSKWKQCTAIVYPLETASFVRFKTKKVNGFRSSCRSQPLATDYITRINRTAASKVATEVRAVVGVAAQSHNDEELLYKCRKSGIKYVDMYFKPSAESLKRAADAKNIAQMDFISWRRPQDIIPKEAHGKIKLFRHGIEPADIGQGQLGDCWLMCAIAVVANSTTMVKDMFRHPVSESKQKKEQKAGGYRVYLNKCGYWQNVIVDNYIPTFNSIAYFGQSRNDPYEMWVSMLEKAYAKVHGSYASIIGGDALHALQDLTGFPVYSFADVWKDAMRDEDAATRFFKDLLRYKKKRYLISIGTPGRDTSGYNQGNGARNDAAFEERYRNAGLGMGHAYSVLSVRQFNMPRINLVKIRNPWGSGVEWKGAWGAGSDKWKRHPFVRRSCKPSKRGDGTFWMEWKDVVQYFDGGGVCMVKKKWYDYRFQGHFTGIYPSFALKIEVKKKQKVFFTLSQKDRRMLDPNDPEKLYKGFLIAVSHQEADVSSGRQVVTAVSTINPEEHPNNSFTYVVRRDVGLEMELLPTAGAYYVIPRIMVANKFGPKEFTLGLLTPVKSTADGLRVSFVKLPNACQIFKNNMSFSVDGAQCMNMQFQYKKRGGVPRLKEGITVFGAGYVKEDFPFPY